MFNWSAVLMSATSLKTDYIRELVLKKLVLEAVSDLADFVRCHEPVFLCMLSKNAMRQKKYKQLQQTADRYSHRKRNACYDGRNTKQSTGLQICGITTGYGLSSDVYGSEEPYNKSGHQLTPPCCPPANCKSCAQKIKRPEGTFDFQAMDCLYNALRKRRQDSECWLEFCDSKIIIIPYTQAPRPLSPSFWACLLPRLPT